MGKKKVLVINTANTGLTGITSVILNYASVTYKQVDYEFVLAGNYSDEAKKKLEKYGKNIYIPPCSRVRQPLRYTRWLKRLIKQNGYDVVHVHANSGTAYFDVHAAKAAKVPVRICHSHSSFCKYKMIHKLLRGALNREMTIGLACSDLAAKWLFENNYVLLKNGIDMSRFKFNREVRDEYRKILGIENNFVIGHVGLMKNVKNHAFLLSVFKELVLVRPEARLILIGDGELRADIEKYIEENNLKDKVLVLGERRDVAELYQCMDVFVLPSLFEGLPVSMLEAQTSGLHCVVSDNITGQANLTNNVTYIGIKQEKVGKWVKHLNKLDVEGDRQKYSAVMEKTDFNIERCAETLLKIYNGNALKKE